MRGPLSTSPLEDIGRLVEALPDIWHLAQKYRNYRDFKAMGGDAREQDFREVNGVLRMIPRPGPEPPLTPREDVDNLGRALVYYIERSSQVGFWLHGLQGYIMPTDIVEIEWVRIVDHAVSNSDVLRIVPSDGTESASGRPVLKRPMFSLCTSPSLLFYFSLPRLLQRASEQIHVLPPIRLQEHSVTSW